MIRARFLCLILLALTVVCQANSTEKMFNDVSVIYPGKQIPGTFTKHGNVMIQDMAQSQPLFLRINQKDRSVHKSRTRYKRVVCSRKKKTVCANVSPKTMECPRSPHH